MAQFEQTGVDAIVKGFGTFIVQMKAVNKSIAATGIAGKVSSAGMTALNVGLKGAMIAAGLAAAAIGAVAVALGVFGVASVKAAGSVEQAFAGLAKTTNGLTDDTGKMNEAGEEMLVNFRNLSKEIPLMTEELLEIGALGGQLNVPKNELKEFTESVAAISISTDLVREKAALDLGQISSIFADEIDSMSENSNQLGSALVFAGNNFGVLESQVLTFVRRTAGTGKAMGFMQADLVGMGTAFAKSGIEAQAGGTAIQTVMIEMGKAVADGVGTVTEVSRGKLLTLIDAGGTTFDKLAEIISAGGEDLADFAKSVGVSVDKVVEVFVEGVGTTTSDTLLEFAKTAGIAADEFVELWETNPAEAFTLFVEGLDDAGDEAFTILENLGIADRRLTRGFITVAKSGDLLRDAIRESNIAFEEGTALAREASIFYATFESKVKILKNTFRDAAVGVGLEFLPVLERIIDVISPVVEAFGQALAPAIEGIVATINEDFIPAVGNLIQSLGIDFDPKSIGESIAGMGESISGVITRISELINILAEGGLEGLALELGIPQETIDGITKFVDKLKDIDFEPILKIAGFIIIAAGVANALLALIPVILAVSAAIGGFLVVLGNIGAFVSLAIGAIAGGGGLITILAGVLAAFVALVGAPVALAIAIGLLIAAIVIFGKEALENFLVLKDQVVIIFNELKARLFAATSGIRLSLETFAEGVLRVFLGLWTVLVGIFTLNFEKIKVGFMSFLQGLLQIVIGGLGAIANIFIFQLTTIINLVSGFVRGVIEFFKNLFDELVGNSIIPDMFTTMVEVFVRGFKILLEKVKKFFVGMIKLGLSFIVKFIELGQKIIQGIIDGMKKMAGKLIGAIVDLVEAAIAAAKKALGIGSPSKEFFDVGKNIGIGLADGIRSEAANVKRAMFDVTDGIKKLPFFDPDPPRMTKRQRTRLFDPSFADREMQDRTMPINTGQTNTNIDRSSNPTVNANYFVAQAPNAIIDDLALIAMLSANR